AALGERLGQRPGHLVVELGGARVQAVDGRVRRRNRAVVREARDDAVRDAERERRVRRELRAVGGEERTAEAGTLDPLGGQHLVPLRPEPGERVLHLPRQPYDGIGRRGDRGRAALEQLLAERRVRDARLAGEAARGL